VKCQARFGLIEVLRGEKGKVSFTALALVAPGVKDAYVRIYTEDPQKLLSYLRNLVEERKGLLQHKDNLIDTKLALEESVTDLLKTKAKVRMIEEELRRVRKMSWWQRLLWRG
jgi:hypothetical protein